MVHGQSEEEEHPNNDEFVKGRKACIIAFLVFYHLKFLISEKTKSLQESHVHVYVYSDFD